MRARVSSLTRPSPRNALLTVGWLTPARAAISLMETRFLFTTVYHFVVNPVLRKRMRTDEKSLPSSIEEVNLTKF